MPESDANYHLRRAGEEFIQAGRARSIAAKLPHHVLAQTHLALATLPPVGHVTVDDRQRLLTLRNTALALARSARTRELAMAHLQLVETCQERLDGLLAPGDAP